MRVIFPGRYPKAPSPAVATRAEVRPELEAAIRNGEVLSDGDAGLQLNEIYPWRYPRPVAVAGNSNPCVRMLLSVNPTCCW